MQLKLTFLEIAEPVADVWRNLNREQQLVIIDKLAERITRTALATHEDDVLNREDDIDD